MLVEGKSVVGAFGEFECGHVVVLGSGLPGGRDRCHCDVGQNITLQTQRAPRPRRLDQAVISLIDGQFATPIFFQNNASDQRTLRGDRTSVKLAVNGGEQERSVVQANKIHCDFTRCEAYPVFGPLSKVSDRDVEPQFVVLNLNARAGQHRPVLHRTGFIQHDAVERSIGETGGGG